MSKEIDEDLMNSLFYFLLGFFFFSHYAQIFDSSGIWVYMILEVRTRNSRDRRSEPPPGGIGRMGFKKRVSYEECLWASGKVKKERVCY